MTKNADLSDADFRKAEKLRNKAIKDKVKDTKREAQIAKLEAGDDLLSEVSRDNSQGNLRPDRDDRRDKAKPAKLERGWYSKTYQAQRRVLQKVTGSYRPEPGDPVSQKARGAAVKEGRLWDPHHLSRVRALDVQASNAITVDVPVALPVAPVDPGKAEEPIPGCCWWCYTPFRKRDRKGTKFCTNNMGECRKAWNEHSAERVAQQAAWDAYSDSLHADWMFSVHVIAAEKMSQSARRCGVEATFTANGDGVMAIHTDPLPPFNPQALANVECAGGTLETFKFGTQRIYGFNLVDVAIVATPVANGTWLKFELAKPPEGTAMAFYFGFEGDPGPEWRAHQDPKPPAMSGSYAARNGRAAEYVKNAKTANLFNDTSDFERRVISSA